MNVKKNLLTAAVVADQESALIATAQVGSNKSVIT